MAFTSVVPWVVGNRLTQTLLNKMVTAIQELQDEVTTGRPQLRVYAPASVTGGGAIVPYANVRTDTHGGWNATSKYYTVPKAGMYQIAITYKCGAVAATPSQFLGDFSSSSISYISGANGLSGAYSGSSVSGCLYFAQGTQLCVREQGATYTPQNDATTSPGTGSNFLHITYLGPV